MIDELNTKDEALKQAELNVIGCFCRAHNKRTGEEAVKAMNYIPNGSYFSNSYRGMLWDLILLMVEEGTP